jgi:hypothetical protein
VTASAISTKPRGDEMKKLDRVVVYYDPFTVHDVEGIATIMTEPDAENQMDRKGRPMFRCVVCFEGENQGYFRTISEKAREQV